VRLDGTGDEFLDDDFAGYAYQWRASPNELFRAGFERERSRYNERSRSVFVISTPEGSEIARLNLREIGDPWNWAWLEDSSGILFNRGRRLNLTAYDIESESFSDKVQYTADGDRYATWSRLPDPVGHQVRLIRRASREPQNVLWAVDDIDLDTGEVSTIFEVSGRGRDGAGEWYCSEYVTLSPDRQRFFFTTCEPFPHAPTLAWKTHFHVVDLESGADRRWLTIEGHITGRLRMSPSADRMLAEYRVPLTDPSRDLRPPALWDWRKVSVVINPDGEAVLIDEGWFGLDWIDANRVLVAYVPEALDPSKTFTSATWRPFTRLAVLDVTTMNFEVFYR
jgi:hypothetical protein